MPLSHRRRELIKRALRGIQRGTLADLRMATSCLDKALGHGRGLNMETRGRLGNAMGYLDTAIATVTTGGVQDPMQAHADSLHEATALLTPLL